MLQTFLALSLALSFSPTGGRAAPSEAADHRPSLAALEFQTISIHWEGRALEDALRDLGVQLGFSFVLAPELRDRAGDAITVSLSRVRGVTVLRILRSFYDVRFLWQGGVIWVTTEAEAIRRTAVTRIYDVRAALHRPPDFPAPERRVGLPRPGAGGDDPEPAEIPHDPMDVEEFAEIVRSGTGRDLWDFEGVSLTTLPGRLVVRHSPEVHRKIQRILFALGG